MQRTGDIVRDFNILLKRAGIKKHRINTVTNPDESFVFTWEEFELAIAGVEYSSLTEISEVIVIKGDKWTFVGSGNMWVMRYDHE